jgi:mRNA interferase HicA
VTGSEFLRRLRRFGRARGLVVIVDEKRGKGSHATVYLGGRRTVVKDRKKELGAGLLRAMLGQLGIDPKDF